MAVIYTEDWAAGNSLFTESGYAYSRPVDGTDPLYPYVSAAEGVWINGDGRLDKNPIYTGEFETYQQAGAWIKGPGPLDGGGPGIHGGPGFWNATYGCMQCVYYPTTESLAAINPGLNSCPLISLASPNAGGVVLGVDAQLADALLVIYHQNDGSHAWDVSITGAPMPVAGEPYVVRIGWQCGTYDEDLGTALADGFVRLWINDELVYEALNISLLLNGLTVPGNLVDSILLGFFGMIGPLGAVSVSDSACAPLSPVLFGSGTIERPQAWMKITFKETP